MDGRGPFHTLRAMQVTQCDVTAHSREIAAAAPRMMRDVDMPFTPAGLGSKHEHMPGDDVDRIGENPALSRPMIWATRSL